MHTLLYSSSGSEGLEWIVAYEHGAIEVYYFLAEYSMWQLSNHNLIDNNGWT